VRSEGDGEIRRESNTKRWGSVELDKNELSAKGKRKRERDVLLEHSWPDIHDLFPRRIIHPDYSSLSRLRRMLGRRRRRSRGGGGGTCVSCGG